MDTTPLIAKYAQRVELLLIQHFGAQGADLSARIASVASEFPEEFNAELQDLAQYETSVTADRAPSEALAEFAFRCGQIAERLENFSKTKAAEDLMFVRSDGQPATDLDKTDLAALSRFLAARDRVLRKAADVSLKILVIAAGFLILGFLLGLL